MAVVEAYNLAKVTTATTGTGTITLGSAVSGFLTFAGAGVKNGETVSYGIRDGSNSEVGRGVYTSSGATLTRSVLTSTNSNSAINLSGSATVFITPLAEDLSYANRNVTFNAPLASQFTDKTVYGNGSSSTGLTQTDDAATGMVLTDGSADTSGFKTVLRAIPGSPTSFSVAAKVMFQQSAANQMSGICFANASGKMFSLTLAYAGGSPALVIYNPSWTGSYADNSYSWPIAQITWLKLSYDASGNIHHYVSQDGTNWVEIYTGATLSGRGVTSPTKYGFLVGSFSSARQATAVQWFYSDEFSAPSSARIA